MNVISVRSTSDLERKIRKLMEFEKSDKSSIIRKALEKGVNEELKRLALNLYIERKVSLAKAAEIAEISTRDLLKLIKERGLSLNITVEDLKKDFKEAMK
ncbi:MAG: UPF0175 family protein [Archaeoglobaceae archaeon]|nr:UPF0175 family protein [Archaeoglobaceae archaeon]